jgi:hypothetical protein
MGNTRVLIDLTKEVLTIDQLQRPAPEVAKPDASSFDLERLPLRRPADEVLR